MGGSYGWPLLKMLLALAAVCAAAYVALRFVVRRTLPASRGPIRVRARVAVEPRRSLLVVDVAGRSFLVGSAESGLTLIAELDPAALDPADASSERRSTP